MLLHVLFGQRKEAYEGEYAPEALNVMTEYDYAENPQWLLDKLDRESKEKHWESVKIVKIEISLKELMEAVRPLELAALNSAIVKR